MSTDMQGKVCLVTGATSGIGAVAARRLAEMGATVIVHGRRAQRCEATVAAIRAASGNANVSAVLADFASLADVRALAEAVKAKTEHLDVLVNNAGAVNLKRLESRDGYELTFASNHLAPFLLTNLLLDRLKAAPQGRVVTVSSSAHYRGRLDFDDLQGTRNFHGWNAYGTSKLCNIYFTRALARRLEGTRVTANVLHPGVVHTGLGSNTLLIGFLMKIGRPFIITAEQGAETIVYLATAPEVADKSGGFYEKCALAPTSRLAQDDAIGERLWTVSEQLVHLSS